MAEKNGKKSALDNADDKTALSGVKPVMGPGASESDTNVDDNNGTTPSNNKFSPTRIQGKGSSVKQEKIAEAISGNGAGSVGAYPTDMNSGLRSIPYSGADARIIDNASGTPIFDKNDRRDSRYGQKTDNTARHLNFVPSETYILEYDGPKPLSESADKVQGSLGHPANEFARIQKASEAFPGAINFERSVDEVTDDVVLACQGQQLSYHGDDAGYESVDPTVTRDETDHEKIPYHLDRGNFIPHKMNVKYNSSGELLDFYFDEEEYKANANGDLVSERACTHRVTAANRAEIDRQNMAAKAGNEVRDDWSPIPYAYDQPTRDVLYLSTVEKMLGANTFVAVKMAAKAHSYQVSKAAKDGMRTVSAGAEIALGNLFAKSRSDVYDNFTFGRAEDNASVFNRQYTSKGAPSAIVAMLDSIAKYHDRSDLLNQPRSFNMVLKTGLSNYKPFKIDPEFAKIFDNVNVFSTIDRPYDPSVPTCILDGVKIMNPYSLNELGSCFRTATVSIGYESDVDDSKSYIFQGKKGIYLTQTAGTTNKNSYQLVGTIKKKLTQGDIDGYTVTAADIEDAAKLVRQEAVAIKGCKLFEDGYVVAFAKDGESSTGKFKFVFFSFSDRPMASGEYAFVIHYKTTTDQTENVSLNSLTIDTSSAKLIYNNYLSAWYHNRQNWYYVQLRDPYTDGIKQWLRRNFGLMSKVVETTGYTFTCPIFYATKYFSTYAYIVMLAMKYMQEQRAIGFIDVLNYANNFGYPFTDVDNLDSWNALGGKQYGQSDIFNQLEVRQMSPDIAIRWLFPEVFTNLKKSTSGDEDYRVLHPWYMNEDNFNIYADSMSLDHDRAVMSYPVTRSGVRLSYADDLYGFEERDVRLILDQMVVPPKFNGADSASIVAQVYKYSQASDGLIVLPGGVTVNEAMSTPRELGYIFPVRNGFVTAIPDDSNNTISSSTTLTFADYGGSNLHSGHPSIKVYCWINKEATVATAILATGSSITRRASSFTQKYYVFSADDSNAGTAIGLCFSTKDIISSGAAVSGVSSFNPFTNGILSRGSQTPTNDSASTLFTFAMALWTRMQKLPFALNPFDFSGNNVTVDPYSFNYIFGLVGFRSSDYKEDLYNRLTRRMSEGWKFISDPFVEDSLLIK